MITTNLAVIKILATFKFEHLFKLHDCIILKYRQNYLHHPTILIIQQLKSNLADIAVSTRLMLVVKSLPLVDF